MEAQESKKVCLDVLRKFWLQRCAVIPCRALSADRQPHPALAFMSDGAGIARMCTLFGSTCRLLPHREDAPRDWDSDGSSVRARPARPVRKSRKRKRPSCYVPVPLPEADVGELLPERRSQRVLPLQRAPRSRSRNGPRRTGQRR